MKALEVPASFSAPGEGETTWFQPNRMTVKATAETTGGAFGLVETFIPAGSGPPLNASSAHPKTRGTRPRAAPAGGFIGTRIVERMVRN